MSELKLRLRLEGDPERVIRIPSTPFVIGRLPECDLCLPYSEVSRQHMRLTRTQDNWSIEDLGSTNGTLLNQTLLRRPQRLHHNDLIQVGTICLVVHIEADAKTQPDLGSCAGGQTILRPAEEMRQRWIAVSETAAEQQEQQRAIARLKYLVEISKNLNSAESIDAIFEQVQTVVFKEITSIQRLALLVDVQGDGELQIVDAAARYDLPSYLETRTHSWISRSISQRVFGEKVAIKTVDAQEDERFENENSILAKGIRGALAVPLWDRDNVVGVLYADASLNLKTADANDEEDLSFFSTLANLVAYSVQRWLLTRKLQAEGKIRQQLERYHSPAVVQQLLAVGALENGRLKPVEAEISIVFADIVGFSTMAEHMTPVQIAQMLDRFFEEMLQSVFEWGGTLDKFIGDCIMAFFGAPEPQSDHAVRAVAAAMGMLERLDQLNAQQVWSQPLELHVAVNSGKAVVGDVGSSQRVDYTVLGATVNLAARLEAVCPPGECLISEATYRALEADRQRFVPFGAHRFKGSDRPVEIFCTQRRFKGPRSRPAPDSQA